MAHDHDHDDGHGHPHEPRDPEAARLALRAEALEALLVERGIVRRESIDAIVARYENEIGPLNGAKLVARAWIDPDFKRRLLADARAAIAELSLPVGETATPIVVVENTRGVHNVVVCTLCSCYPSSLLGLPPRWYKSPPYRARVVREPRTVLREFGLELPETTEVRVWDSSAELRYMVLPERPPGSEGASEAELVELVSRDSLIGVALAGPPPALGETGSDPVSPRGAA
jgi:nitrile hydratase